MLGVVMNVLCYVLMVCWNQHMASIEMYIFSVDVVLITCWNIRMHLFWCGHASAEPINSSFRGNPYLITRLYSLKYKVTCVVHVSRAWISRYIFFCGFTSIQNLAFHIYRLSKKIYKNQNNFVSWLKLIVFECCSTMSNQKAVG